MMHMPDVPTVRALSLSALLKAGLGNWGIRYEHEALHNAGCLLGQSDKPTKVSDRRSILGKCHMTSSDIMT